MIEFNKVNEILKGTLATSKAQGQANAAQAAPPQAAGGLASANQAAANQLFAQLGALINQASSQPAQSDPDLAALQRQAALLNARATALIAKADALEAELNLSPTPDTKSIDDLIAQFKEIMQELDAEIEKLQKQINERKKANEMKQTQKPTSLKPGEDPNDPSFNTQLSVV